jgi:5-methylcytosine-specific restriction endonuclease McrA
MLIFCDDSGVHEYSVYRLKLEVFPGKDDISKENIGEFLKELEQEGLLKFYEVNDKKYLRYVNFQEHQRIDQPTFKFPWENGKIPVKKSKKNAEQLNNDPRNSKDSSRKRKEQKIFLIQRDGNHCKYCKSTTKTLTVDHIIPPGQGGTDHVDNLCLACRQCNSSKSNKLGKPRRVLAEGKEREAEENNQGNLDENNTNSPEIDQKMISSANLTAGVEGKGISRLSPCSLNNNNNYISGVNNIYKKQPENLNNNFKGNNKKQAGRPRIDKKWDSDNYEDIPADIRAGYDSVYQIYFKKKARIEGLCAYANMHGGTGATEEERKQMIAAIPIQDVEIKLRRQNGERVIPPHIDTWIRNRRFEDEVDLPTPQFSNKKEVQSKSHNASKFMKNAMRAAQQNGDNQNAN